MARRKILRASVCAQTDFDEETLKRVSLAQRVGN